MAARAEFPRWIPTGLLAIAAVVLGALAGADPRTAVAAAMAALLLLVTLNNLVAGLVVFVVLSFLELVPNAAGPALSLAKVAGGLLAISWVASAATRPDERQFPAAHQALAALAVVFVAWNALSMVWSAEQSRAVISALSFALNFALLPIVYSAVRTKQQARYVMGAFVAGATLAAGYGIAAPPDASEFAGSPAAASGLDRLAGTIGDPNEFATLLVAGMALAGGLLFDRETRPTVRWMLLGSMALLLTGVLLTLSRGGLVALGAALLVGVLVAGRHRGQTLLATATVVLASLFFYFAVASEAARDRVTATDGGSGRTDIWDIGWRMVEDNPVVGVGAGNFQNSSIHYLIGPGAIRFDEFLVDEPSVAHNAYLQVLAEIGIVGLVMFLLLVCGLIATGVRARRRFIADGDDQGELLTRAVLMATAAVLAGIFFLSEEHSKHLWLLLSLFPALMAISGAERRE